MNNLQSPNDRARVFLGYDAIRILQLNFDLDLLSFLFAGPV